MFFEHWTRGRLLGGIYKTQESAEKEIARQEYRFVRPIKCWWEKWVLQ